jgi:hypothetical protein
MIRSLLVGAALLGLIGTSAGAQQAYESHTPGYGRPAMDGPGTTTTTVERSTDPYSGAMIEQRTVTQTTPRDEPEWVQRLVAADMARDGMTAQDQAMSADSKPLARHHAGHRAQPPAPPPGY